jgi:hypothetical protein
VYIYMYVCVCVFSVCANCWFYYDKFVSMRRMKVKMFTAASQHET